MAGFISKETIDTVNRSADIVSIVGDYVRLTRKGSDFWGCCPFHQEKSASFHVIPEKGMYYCFGCHAGGGAVKFLQEMENIPFPEAVIQIAKKQGIEVRYEEGSGAPKDFKYDDTKDRIIELYERVSTSFHYILMETPTGREALEYLYRRGLTEEIIKKFKLGYAPADRKWLRNFLRSKNFSDEFLNNSGLFFKNYPEISFFNDRVMCPIFNRKGQVVAFSGRILHSRGEDDRKYMNTSEMVQYQKKETLYGYNFAKQAVRNEKRIIVCEGNMDIIAYHQAGIECAVATCGTALTEDHLRMIKGMADTIYLSFDSDDAGQKATWKAILMCRANGFTVKIIRLQGGKDPSEILLKFGSENLSNQVKSAIMDSDYLFDVLSHQYPIDTPEGKTKAALAFFPYVDALQNNIQKESSLEQFGQLFKIDSNALHKDYQNRQEAAERAESRQKKFVQEQPVESPAVKMTAEFRAVLTVISDVKQYEYMRRNLTEEDFEDSNAKELFIILEECYRQGDLTLSTILAQCKNPNMQNIIASSIATGEYSTNTEFLVHDSVALIRKNSLERQRASILNKIRILQSSGAFDEGYMRQLLEEKMDIDKQLK